MENQIDLVDFMKTLGKKVDNMRADGDKYWSNHAGKSEFSWFETITSLNFSLSYFDMFKDLFE